MTELRAFVTYHWLVLLVIAGVLGGVLWWAFRPVPPPVVRREPKGPQTMRHTLYGDPPLPGDGPPEPPKDAA